MDESGGQEGGREGETARGDGAPKRRNYMCTELEGERKYGCRAE